MGLAHLVGEQNGGSTFSWGTMFYWNGLFIFSECTSVPTTIH